MKKYEKALIYLFPFFYVGFGWIGFGAGLRALSAVFSIGTYWRPILFMFHFCTALVLLTSLVPLIIYNVLLLLKDDENSPRRIYTELALVIILVALLIIFEPPLFEFIEQYHLDDFFDLFR